ncbi:M20 metallopeptidase family protein [Intestinibacter bartlettii]|jgi:amidohydrolase|uniref:M20 metallopeptidase family protein n=1 Tax=Intestinibacter bartlettii TaxID=261299 RepID=UPI0028FE13CA|nr:M20 family metallopeptidase [Intestinibacter bartlettii]MDU2163682.1 M20 family metallopeptidase [Intestinibacter bartlettii]
MNKFLKRAQELEASMKSDRHYLHQNAEVGFDLPITTKYVMDRLQEIGLEPKEICKSGVTALIEGKKPGKTYLLRADMDALSMNEENVLEFASKTNAAHNCGHDMHTAILLGAAQILKENVDELEGNVRLMFQPNEEAFLGSKAMIEAGILDDVDVASCMHMMLDYDASNYACAPGFFSSSCDGFKITVNGKGCHGAMPHLGIDPINVGMSICTAFQQLVSRETPPKETASLTFGQFSGGNTPNIVPDKVVIQGTLRTYNAELRAKLVNRMQTIVKSAGEMYGTTVEYEVLSDVPSIYVNPEMLEEVKTYLSEIEGLTLANDNFRITPSDDMAFISEKVPTVYLLLQARVKDNPYPHHNPKVLFDESAMTWGAAMHAQCAFEWLRNHK